MENTGKDGRFLVTGDTHGEQARLVYLARWIQEGDILFIAGDFGYDFLHSKEEQMFLNDVYLFLREKNASIVYVDGNHENHAELNKLPIEEWCGARVHRLRPNIIHVLRGEVLEIRGKRIFCFGGAFSIDRAYRERNKTYWEEELPVDKDYKNGIENLKKCGYKVDFILTHTCPLETVYSLNGRYDAEDEFPLQNYLEWVRERVEYKKWYFGHWHQDKILWRNQMAVYYDVISMITGKRILDDSFFGGCSI